MANQNTVEATIPTDDWFGPTRSGAIVGKPGAWRNRESRCEHGVERSTTRCWTCDPLGVGETRCVPVHTLAMRRPRPCNRATRSAFLVSLLGGGLPLELAREKLGVDVGTFTATVRALRNQSLIRVSSEMVATLTARGRLHATASSARIVVVVE